MAILKQLNSMAAVLRTSRFGSFVEETPERVPPPGFDLSNYRFDRLVGAVKSNSRRIPGRVHQPSIGIFVVALFLTSGLAVIGWPATVIASIGYL